MPFRNLILIRHGQYENSRGDQGELTDYGIDQMKLAARALKTTHIDAIHHSTVIRAEHSAKIIHKAFPYLKLNGTDLLRECVPSVPQRLLNLFEFQKRSNPHTEERTARCIEQFELAYDYFCAPLPAHADETHELMVCHGNIIRYFVVRTLNANVDSWINMLMHNGGITRIRIDPDGHVVLISHNDIGHLPTPLRTHG